MRSVLHDKLISGRVRHGPYGTRDADGFTGAFVVQGPCGAQLSIIASEGTRDIPWEHVSVSTARRIPNWTEMCFVKDLFWQDEECVVQYHPPKSAYVCNHPYVLHLWRYKTKPFPMPPSIAVGIKEDGEYANAEEARAGYQRAKDRGDI